MWTSLPAAAALYSRSGTCPGATREEAAAAADDAPAEQLKALAAKCSSLSVPGAIQRVATMPSSLLQSHHHRQQQWNLRLHGPCDAHSQNRLQQQELAVFVASALGGMTAYGSGGLLWPPHTPPQRCQRLRRPRGGGCLLELESGRICRGKLLRLSRQWAFV